MERNIVVGAGFSGAVIARSIAEILDRPVEVIEKRSHIAGNMFDEIDENNILVQRYGPHIICTDHYRIIEYLNHYSDFFQFTVKFMAQIDGKYVRLPYNFETIQQLVGPHEAEYLLAKMRSAFRGQDRVPILELIASEVPEIAAYGQLLFEKAYRPYLAKQWDIPIETIGPEIMGRVPMAMSYDERYMNKDFQYLPKNGFTQLFQALLDHPNITVRVNDDALDHIRLDEQTRQISFDGEQVDCLAFTGPIDELFGLKYGCLPYRSLDVTYEHSCSLDVLPATFVSFPQAEGYTRKTDYREMMYDSSGGNGTIVATEYPIGYSRDSEKGGTPYYPVLTKASHETYDFYLTEAGNYPALYLCGRLAEFRYYNMDDCIMNAFSVFERIKENAK